MPHPEDNGDVLAKIDEIREFERDAGRASRQPEVDQLTAERDAERDAMRLHMLEKAPAGHPTGDEPPPPVPTALLGASYGSGADKELYRRRAQSARLYYTGNLPTDLKAGSMFKLAYEHGIRHFLISYRGTQGEVAVGNAFSTLPSDVTALATFWHEPEDNIRDGDISLADWRARNIRDAKVLRDVGVVPVSNLMQYTLTANDRDVSDYYLDGAHEGMTFDYYMNPLKGKDNPEEAVDRMVSAALEGGARFTGLGEAGVPDVVPDDTRVALIKRLRAKILATPEVRFAQFWSSGEFRFVEATATAWFEGR